MAIKIDAEKLGKDFGFIDETGTIIPSLAYALNNNVPVLLSGDTGTGKTFLAQEICKAAGLPYETLNFYNTTNATKILGGYKPIGDKFQWIDGVLTHCMREGKVFIGEESNFMRSEVSSVLYPVMDFRRETVLDEHPDPNWDGKGMFKPERIKAHPDFRIILTCNLNYRGTERFNPAIKNRIGCYIHIDYLSVENEAKLIESRYAVGMEMATKLCKIANGFRSSREETGYDPVSTRIIEEWAKMIKHGTDPIKAAKNTVAPCLTDDPEEQKMIMVYVGESFKPVKKRGKDDEE